MGRLCVALLLMIFATPLVFAQKKDCEELKSEIAAKLDAKNVKGYALEIVAADSVKEEKVVGTCDAGSKKILYKRQ